MSTQLKQRKPKNNKQTPFVQWNHQKTEISSQTSDLKKEPFRKSTTAVPAFTGGSGGSGGSGESESGDLKVKIFVPDLKTFEERLNAKKNAREKAREEERKRKEEMYRVEIQFISDTIQKHIERFPEGEDEDSENYDCCINTPSGLANPVWLIQFPRSVMDSAFRECMNAYTLKSGFRLEYTDYDSNGYRNTRDTIQSCAVLKR